LLRVVGWLGVRVYLESLKLTKHIYTLIFFPVSVNAISEYPVSLSVCFFNSFKKICTHYLCLRTALEAEATCTMTVTARTAVVKNAQPTSGGFFFFQTTAKKIVAA